MVRVVNFSRTRELLSELGKPIAEHLPEIARSVMEEKRIGIVSSPTGSGKSVGVASEIAKWLSDNPSHNSADEILVLVPRVLLATDLAKNIAELTETEVGLDVGYMIGRQAGGSKLPLRDRKPRITVSTYGAALVSGKIQTSGIIFLDETHEADQHISLAQSIIFEELKNREDLRVIEMSATIEANRHENFWKKVGRTHTTILEGNGQLCDFVQINPEESESTLEQEILNLLFEPQNQYIAVFMNGVKDITRTAINLRKMLDSIPKETKEQYGINSIQIDIIHSDLTPEERAKAQNPPKSGQKKILIGTPVIESGINLPFQAGISTGIGNVPYDREETGATALVPENLPVSRIMQQIGRIGRFPMADANARPKFVLFSSVSMNERAKHATAEVERCSLNPLAFRAACLGYNPENLTFVHSVPRSRIESAKRELCNLGLINEDWSLTRDGEYVAKLPLSPESAAIVCEANKIDRNNESNLKIIEDAIIVAAILDIGSLRAEDKYAHNHNPEHPHGKEYDSDLIDALMAFREIQTSKTSDIKGLLKSLNVSEKRFNDVRNLVQDICEQLNIRREPKSPNHEQQEQIKQAILAGSVNKLFAKTREGLFQDLVISDNAYPVSDRSVVYEHYTSPLVTGKLREIPARHDSEDDKPVTLINSVSSISAACLLKLAARKGNLLSAVYCQPLLSTNSKKGKGRGDNNYPYQITATYLGDRDLTLVIGHDEYLELEDVISQLVNDEAYVQPKHVHKASRSERKSSFLQA